MNNLQLRITQNPLVPNLGPIAAIALSLGVSLGTWPQLTPLRNCTVDKKLQLTVGWKNSTEESVSMSIYTHAHMHVYIFKYIYIYEYKAEYKCIYIHTETICTLIQKYRCCYSEHWL